MSGMIWVECEDGDGEDVGKHFSRMEEVDTGLGPPPPGKVQI